MKNLRTHFRSAHASSFLIFCSIASLSSVKAINLHWNPAIPEGEFVDPNNWLDSAGEPANRFPQTSTPLDYAFIGSGAIVNLNLANLPSGTHSMGSGGIRVGIQLTDITWATSGQASMTISGAGTFSSAQVHIGRLPTGDGTLTISPESTMIVGGELWVGRTGGTANLNVYGTIAMPDSGTRHFEIGHGADENEGPTTGTVTVYEGGVIQNLHRFWIGQSGGVGNLNIEGGTVEKVQGGNSMIVGQGTGSEGTLNQSAGTLNFFANNQGLFIGNEGGKGVYNLSGGLLNITGGEFVVGRTSGNADSNGTLIFSGGTIRSLVPLQVGQGSSTGHFSIEGGEFEVRRIFGGTGVSSASFGGGTIIATAPSELETPFIGNFGTATVDAGGLHIDANGLDIHLSQHFLFENDGIISLSNSDEAASRVTFLGLNSASSEEAEDYSILIGDRVTLDIVIDDGNSPTIDRSLSGAGSLVKSGVGSLTLSQTAYTGDTNVEAGTLALAQPTLDNNATLSVQSGARLHLAHNQTDVVGSLVLAGDPKGPGIYDAGNSDGLITGEGRIAVISSSPGFQGFMDGFPELTEAQKAADADPDGDGIVNLMEYALGLNPTVTNSLPALVENMITFSKGALAVSNGDVNYVIETSPTLGADPHPWTEVTPEVNNDDEISYSLPPSSSESPRNFVRLRVEINEAQD